MATEETSLLGPTPDGWSINEGGTYEAVEDGDDDGEWAGNVEAYSEEVAKRIQAREERREHLVQVDATTPRRPFVPQKGDPLQQRMRYYDRLQGASRHLSMPAHVVPAELLVRTISFTEFGLVGEEEEEEEAGPPKQDGVAEGGKKIGSMTLIFSIWNTMMGSSLLALPWGYSVSGLALGMMVTFLIGAVCCYTCVLVIRWGKDSDDLFYVCQKYLGSVGKIVCWASSIMLLVGSSVAYDILMVDVCNSIVQSLLAFFNTSVTNDYYWNMWYASAIVIGLTFPMTMLKSFGILVKFNTMGIVSVMYTIGFIVVYCLFFEGLEFKNVPLKNTGFVVLTGMLSVSFFIHSLILPILKNSARPENNVRDVTIGYTLVALSYTAIGSIGYLAYWNVLDPMPQQFLQAFSSTNVGALIANFFLFFQLVTVFPLLLLIIRIQFFGLLWESDYPSWIHVGLLNAVIIAIGTAFAIYYPNFGTILSYTGGICGLILVFILPNLIHLIASKQVTGSWGILRTFAHGCIMLLGVAFSVGQFIPQ